MMDATMVPTRDTAPQVRVTSSQTSHVAYSGGISEVAQAFEAAFIAEMLAHAGVGKPPESFGGGAGEEQFASLLHEAQAAELARAGGIGLAEYLVSALEKGGRHGG